jgi:hypothetical protein
MPYYGTFFLQEPSLDLSNLQLCDEHHASAEMTALERRPRTGSTRGVQPRTRLEEPSANKAAPPGSAREYEDY